MPIIEVEHLHKRYRDTVAVEDVSFTVERGEIFGIIGPNGAGKTTTVETVVGLRTPDRGTVRVLGLDPWRDRAASASACRSPWPWSATPRSPSWTSSAPASTPLALIWRTCQAHQGRGQGAVPARPGVAAGRPGRAARHPAGRPGRGQPGHGHPRPRPGAGDRRHLAGDGHAGQRRLVRGRVPARDGGAVRRRSGHRGGRADHEGRQRHRHAGLLPVAVLRRGLAAQAPDARPAQPRRRPDPPADLVEHRSAAYRLATLGAPWWPRGGCCGWSPCTRPGPGGAG